MPNTTPEVAAHFDDMGILTLSTEDGQNIGVHMFSCKSCGSMIVVRTKHWETHQSIPQIMLDA